jgi:hypothetical protein
MIVFLFAEAEMRVCSSTRRLFLLSNASLALLCASVAWAQEEGSSSEAPAPAESPSAAPQGSTSAKRKTPKKVSETSSPFFPDWKPAPFGLQVHPVLGLQYSSNSKTDVSVFQGEAGVYVGAQGIPVIAGNPGFQVEPGLGYAWGKAVVKTPGLNVSEGSYRRSWWGIQTPVYYKFVRQLFGYRAGEVSGGPIEVSKQMAFTSDTGIAVLPHVTAHYTLSYEKSSGENATYPTLNSYDHWLHGRLSADMFNFFVDAGPGFSTSKLTLPQGATTLEAEASGTYLLAVSGMDVLTDKIGFEAQAKYMFSSDADANYASTGRRSPLEDLGVEAQRLGLPPDSLAASAFFGVRRLIGVLGLGWRYNLLILNYSEKNNTKQVKTESNGLGVYAAVKF